MCHLNLLLFLLSYIFYHEINSVEQYGRKACWKRTIIRYDSEKRVVSKLMQIPICCKGWREFNETTCKKAQASRGYPFQDTKIAKNFLRSKRTKRSRLSELDEECEGGSCSYEEAEELELNRVEICGYFKRWKCNRQNCQIGRYCDTLRDNGCEDLSQYVVTCKDCDAGTYGNSCKNRCNCQINDGYWKKECNKINGTCHCEDGYTGVNCTERCEDGFFGSGCNKNCSCQHDNSCNPINGECNCTTPGWKGKYCEQPCDNGTYGVRCQENCTCPANATCKRINGDCVCNSGLRGHNCSEVCKNFTFGEDCKQQCTCIKNNTRNCDPVSGICYCKPGWTESNCTSICTGETFGPGCSLNCSCDDDEYCDPIQGDCYRGICHSPSTRNCAYQLQECPQYQQNENVTGEKMPVFYKMLNNVCEELSNHQNRIICLTKESCICNDNRKGNHCIAAVETDNNHKSPLLQNGQVSNTKIKSEIIIAISSAASIAVILILTLTIILVIRFRSIKERRLKAVQNNGYGLDVIPMNEGLNSNSNQHNDETEEETYDKLDRNNHNVRADNRGVNSNDAEIDDTYSHMTSGSQYGTTSRRLYEHDNGDYSATASYSQDLYSKTNTDKGLASSLHRDDLAEDTYDMMDRKNYDAKNHNRNNDVNGVSAGIEDTYSHMTSESYYSTTSRRLTENDNNDYSVTASYSQDVYNNTDTSQYYDSVQGRNTPFRGDSEYS